MYNDCNNTQIKVGDLIDIKQTINGENKFIVFSLNPLDIRYNFNRNIKYQYDINELLKPDISTGLVEWEIISNIETF